MLDNDTHIPTEKILQNNAITGKVHVTLKATNPEKTQFEYLPASNQDTHEVICVENLSFPFDQVGKQKLDDFRTVLLELLSTKEKALETREKRLDGIRSSYRLINGIEPCSSDSEILPIDLQTEFSTILGKIKMRKLSLENSWKSITHEIDLIKIQTEFEDWIDSIEIGRAHV